MHPMPPPSDPALFYFNLCRMFKRSVSTEFFMQAALAAPNIILFTLNSTHDHIQCTLDHNKALLRKHASLLLQGTCL